MPASIRHILVIRLSALGDVAMTVPVLRAFQARYPDIKITVLSRPGYTALFRDLDNCSVFPVDVTGKHKGLHGIYKLSCELKALKFDAMADLHNVLRSKLLKLFLVHVPFVQIDKGRQAKRKLISGKTFGQLRTTHQRYVDVFAKLGLPFKLNEPSFPERSSLNPEILQITGTDSNPWIGIAPFAGHESKAYPLDLMQQVMEQLSKKATVLLFGGGKKEQKILEDLANNYDQVISLAGKLSLDQELDVISNLDLMISMDSGNGHLAAMMGIKVVTIWGVTHPFAGFAPFNQPSEYSLLSDREQFPLIPTSVYGNRYPEDYKEVARSIPPGAVVAKVEAVLQA